MGMFDELLDSGTEKNQADQKIPGVGHRSCQRKLG